MTDRTAPADPAGFVRPLPASATRGAADAARTAMSALRRRRWLFIGVFAVVMALVIVLAATREKLYTATASMVVNTRELDVAPKDQPVVPDVSKSDNAADTEIEILRSPAVAAGTVTALDLTANPVFAKALAKVSAADRAAVAAAIVGANTKIARPGNSNVVAIQYTAPDPALAKAIANQLGQQYLLVKEDSRKAAVTQVDRGIEDELGGLRDRLEQAEQAVAEYKAGNNLLDTQGQTFTEQELSLYKQNEAAIRANLATEDSRFRAAQQQTHDGYAGGDVSAVLQSPVISDLRSQRAKVAVLIADLAARYTDTHPDLIKLRDQEASLDRAIAAETKRQLSNLKANVAVAQGREADARATVGETTGEIAHNDMSEVKLKELTRKADALRLAYQTLLERRSTINSQALVADDDARIFSPAPMPLAPSYPHKSLIGLFGLLVALILAAAAVWVREMFDRSLVTSSNVEQELGLAHIANVPETSSVARPGEEGIAPVDLPLAKPLSMYAEQLRAVRATILHDRRGDGALSVGLTSARPGEGKSTFAIGLARTSALSGSRVLLIDADIRRPSIARMLGLAPQAGLVEVLQGKAGIEEAIVADPGSSAMLLPTRAAIETGQDLFEPARIARLLDAVRDRFDLILFDTAPTLAVSDSRILLRQLDSVLLLVRWNHTPRQVAGAALRRMNRVGIVPRGVVMTRVDMRALAAFGEGDDDRDHPSYAHYYA